MSKRRLQPPDGDAPTTAQLGQSAPLDLLELAREVCRRYREEYPDEDKRYGDAGIAWCVHDNQYLLSWAVEAANGYLVLQSEVSWLARVLEARGFPLDRLAKNLDIGAEVVLSRVTGAPGERLGALLADAAAFVRSRDTFLE